MSEEQNDTNLGDPRETPEEKEIERLSAKLAMTNRLYQLAVDNQIRWAKKWQEEKDLRVQFEEGLSQSNDARVTLGERYYKLADALKEITTAPGRSCHIERIANTALKDFGPKVTQLP